MELLVEQVLSKIDEARLLYYRLALVVGPSGSGKTPLLHEVSILTSSPVINLNLELARRMLELTERQRALHLSRLMGKIVNERPAELILLDNIEILFEPHLKQDPLRLLQNVSRNKTVVATWNGTITGNQLTYATPDHPEYRRYPVNEVLAISTKQ